MERPKVERWLELRGLLVDAMWPNRQVRGYLVLDTAPVNKFYIIPIVGSRYTKKELSLDDPDLNVRPVGKT